MDRRRRRRQRRHRRCSGEDEDHISGLPDELLHIILLHLGSACAAARTSVLSRRWRLVWAHLPELVFGNAGDDAPPPPASFVDAVDFALSAYAAPTVEAFVAVLPTAADDIPARRVAPWLRFAAEIAAYERFLKETNKLPKCETLNITLGSSHNCLAPDCCIS
ncbi:unnamed protein product [Urochloa humidicola]